MKLRRAKVPKKHEIKDESPIIPLNKTWMMFFTGGDQGYLDIFLQKNYCGRWLAAVEHDPGRGWLAFVHGAVGGRKAKDTEREAAIKAWKASEELPEHFVALTSKAAIVAWNRGVKIDPEFFNKQDPTSRAVQLALFGEVRYRT